MDFKELLQIAGDTPLFETGLLLAGDVDPANVRRQLSRWTAAGKLLQLRRGLYTLAPPYQKTAPHPFLVANTLVKPSYVSLQVALAHAGLIPEYAAEVTSVTTGRPTEVETPLGRYTFRHVKMSRFYGYRRLDVGDDQHAFVARPEKALLDQVYLQPGGESPAYLRGLRLQNLERLDMDVLQRLAARAESPKLERAAANVAALQSPKGDFAAVARGFNRRAAEVKLRSSAKVTPLGLGREIWCSGGRCLLKVVSPLRLTCQSPGCVRSLVTGLL